MAPPEREDDGAIARELGRLADQTPAPGPHFTDSVMQRIALRPRPRPSRWSALFRPRPITLRVRPIDLAGLAAAIALGLVFALRAGPRPAHPPEIAIATPAPSSNAAAPVLIRFSLHAGRARAVSLAGDFNKWRPESTPLVRGPDGVWTVTVPLPPGSWAYSFVVDGKFVEDPLAEAWRDDGFGGKNAVLRIGG